jgi:uncharacterized protein
MLLLTGLVCATWHMPLIYLTALLPIGNPVIGVPLCYAAVVAGSFLYGYLRLASGSLWPSSIAHASHNSAWGIMVGFTATSSPLLVNGYLLGDIGIVITVAAAIGAALVSRLLPPGGDEVRRAKTSARSTRLHERLPLPLKPTEVLCGPYIRILGPSGASAGSR